MKSAKYLSYVLPVAALAFALAPFFSPFNGFDPSAYPNPQYKPPVQPAGYAFSIWGLIYVWLLISTLVGVTIHRTDDKWEPHRLPLLISLVIGTPWLWVAGQSPILATIMIWLMLGFAIFALMRTPLENKLLLRGPVGLYAGWLTAASWVSIGLLGAGYDILLDEFAWAVVCILAAFLTAYVVIRSAEGAKLYTAGVAWALIAIAVKNAHTMPIIALLAGLGAMALGILSLFRSTSRP